jgi:hypothetical protein
VRETDAHSCAGCGSDQCPAAGELSQRTLQGWRLASVSIGCFLVPLVLAVIGAICVRFSPQAQLVGALAGLALGCVSSVLLTKLVDANKEDA